MIKEIQTLYGTLALDSESDAKMLGVLERGAYPNQALISLVQRFLTPESVVVDIGAHVGTFSIPLRCGRVIAFEPAPETFTLLKRNTNEAAGTFILINKGLAARSGSASVVNRVASNAGAQTLVEGGTIVVSTLDAEVSHADLIKIDVEGMEEQVFLGGTTLLKISKPVIVCEINLSQLRAHDSSPHAIERLLRHHGYRLYFPIEQAGVMVSVASIGSLWLLSALVAPRAWLLRSDSAPFDILAVQKGRPLPAARTSFFFAIMWALRSNVISKVRRVHNFAKRYGR